LLPLPTAIKKPIRAILNELQLPDAARQERNRDRRGGLGEDCGPQRAIDLGLAWLARAQDCSTTHDGGVSRHFSLLDGWAPSYPETTGYIIPTFLQQARLRRDESLRERARRMLDWLGSIQLSSGAFQGGTLGCQPIVPVTFNTGQILLGLSAGVSELGEAYREPMRKAAAWLVATQDSDGCWRRHQSPFVKPGDKAYDTHVAWGLLEAARCDSSGSFARAALSNIDWALTQQLSNGWFSNCCLNDVERPLTHTIGYGLRGIIEGYRYSRDKKLLAAALRTANALAGAIREDGALPGRLGRKWDAQADWVCLTGSVQIAACWFLLYKETGDGRFERAARAATRYVRRAIHARGSEDTMGAVKGSFPVDGEYGQYQYLNWACKFAIDANQLELSN
jgi:hypothetical protein